MESILTLYGLWWSKRSLFVTLTVTSTFIAYSSTLSHHKVSLDCENFINVPKNSLCKLYFWISSSILLSPVRAEFVKYISIPFRIWKFWRNWWQRSSEGKTSWTNPRWFSTYPAISDWIRWFCFTRLRIWLAKLHWFQNLSRAGINGLHVIFRSFLLTIF